MQEFCNVYNLKNLVSEPTCFKNVDNPSCIDLVLTNNSRSFLKSSVVETGLSDFHRLTITIMKTNFSKQTPNIMETLIKDSITLLQAKKKRPAMEEIFNMVVRQSERSTIEEFKDVFDCCLDSGTNKQRGEKDWYFVDVTESCEHIDTQGTNNTLLFFYKQFDSARALKIA